MKRLSLLMLAASAATIWIGCSTSEPTKTVAERGADDTATVSTQDLVTVSLSVPNMT